jgi:hypothetical protein
MPGGDTQAPGELLLGSNKDPAWIRHFPAGNAARTYVNSRTVTVSACMDECTSSPVAARLSAIRCQACCCRCAVACPGRYSMVLVFICKTKTHVLLPQQTCT